MNRFAATLRACAIAAPLAFSGAADTVAQTRERAVTTMEKADPFYLNVRQSLAHERCFVLLKAPKNLREWLAVIDEFHAVNERYGKSAFDERAASEFERMNALVDAQRQAGGFAYHEIMARECRLKTS